jgi:hypothetical protein
LGSKPGPLLMRQKRQASRLVLRGRSVAVLALFLSLALSSPRTVLAAIWYESYRNAEEALRAENWNEAVNFLNQAIAEKSVSSSRARTYGLNFMSYFPYLKLGTAYFQLGQYDAAAQALDTEERFGEIKKSAADNNALIELRAKIKEAKESGAAVERARIQQVVTENLSEAARLEQEGKLDAAMIAVGKALAVAPDDAAAKELLVRLQTAISAAAKARELDSRVENLIKEGEASLAAEQYQAAAGKFAEVIILKDTDHTRQLFHTAQARLRAQAESGQRNTDIAQTISVALSDSKALQRDGKLTEALARLQTAVILEPANPEVKKLQETLLAALAADAVGQSILTSVQGYLERSQQFFTSGNYEESLANANSALGLAPDDTEAISYVARAYRSLNERILGKVQLDLPPRIGGWPVVNECDVYLKQGRAAYALLGRGRVPPKDPSLPSLAAELLREPAYKFQGSVFDEAPIGDIAITLTHEIPMPGPGGEVGVASMEPRSLGPVFQPKITAEKQGAEYITHYVVEQKLKPGLSVFLVTVKDPLGTSQSREHYVWYAPPFFRTTPFYLAVAGLMISGFALGFGLKRRKRNSLLKRRFNPFTAGAPVLKDDLFFGRDQLIKNIIQTVHTNSIMLFGERRIGKTSIQHHLKKRLSRLEDPEFVFYAVFIDVQGVPQEAFFSTLGEEIRREMASVLPAEDFAPKPEGRADDGYRELVEDIRKILKALAAREKRKVKLVLLIDEVDQLNTYDPLVNQRLRSLFMRNFSENLSAVVSGVSIKKHWIGEGSPWYNFFEEIEVKPFRHEHAVDLIERPIRGIFKLGPGVTERIIEVTGCRPYLIQKTCIALVNRLHEEGRRVITLEDVEAVQRTAEA